MRVNLYAEEFSHHVERVTKRKSGQEFVGLRIFTRPDLIDSSITIWAFSDNELRALVASMALAMGAAL